MGIFIDDPGNRALLELQLTLLQTVLLHLLRHEVVLRDLILFLCKITADIDHLHTVLQSRLDSVDVVGRRDEKDVRQVVIYIEIIIVERCILLRIKRFKKCRRWIPLYILGKFVHLIQDNHRIGCTCTVDAVQDTSRKRSHVCLSMSADLGFIVHATESDTHVLASQSPGDRLPKTGLSDSRRAVQTEDRRFHIPLELEHCKILYDPFLHLLQSVMILIQHLLSILQIQIVIGHLPPREVKHKLDIVVLNAVVRRTGIVPLQLCHLLVEYLLHGSRPELFLRTGTELGEFLDIIHSELFLDGLELVVEIILPLLLVDLGLHLLIDLLLDLLKLHLSVKNRKKLHSTGP